MQGLHLHSPNPALAPCIAVSALCLLLVCGNLLQLCFSARCWSWTLWSGRLSTPPAPALITCIAVGACCSCEILLELIFSARCWRLVLGVVAYALLQPQPCHHVMLFVLPAYRLFDPVGGVVGCTLLELRTLSCSDALCQPQLQTRACCPNLWAVL